MLVCNVSLRPPRAAIAADIVEAGAAADEAATGNIVFAALIDDSASARDLVDAYSGEIMLEAASADAVVDAGLIYTADVLEEATAIAAHDGVIPIIVPGAVDEAATATDVIDATTAAAAAKTTTGTMMVGPLSAMDATFVAASLTVINVGQ